VAKHLHVYTFEVERNQIDEEEVLAPKQSQKKTRIFGWIEDNVRVAKSTYTALAINLLLIETLDDPAEEESRERNQEKIRQQQVNSEERCPMQISLLGALSPNRESQAEITIVTLCPGTSDSFWGVFCRRF